MRVPSTKGSDLFGTSTPTSYFPVSFVLDGHLTTPPKVKVPSLVGTGVLEIDVGGGFRRPLDPTQTRPVQ